jgi:hypothetical protein
MKWHLKACRKYSAIERRRPINGSACIAPIILIFHDEFASAPDAGLSHRSRRLGVTPPPLCSQRPYVPHPRAENPYTFLEARLFAYRPLIDVC